MTTDQLIEALVADTKPIHPGRLLLRAAIAVPIGLAGALAGMFLLIGVGEICVGLGARLGPRVLRW